MKIENNIGWCDETTNAVTGCDKVSPGCKNCYAEAGTRARVLRAKGIETWGPKGVRHPVNFEPVFQRLNKLCICDGCHKVQKFEMLGRYCDFHLDYPGAYKKHRRIRLFADSNSDWLDDRWPVEILARFLDAIRQAPNVDTILLTKRPEKWYERLAIVGNKTIGQLNKFIGDWIHGNPPSNIWLGVSVENQAMADKRIPELLKIPAAVRFLSMEPLLEKIDFKIKPDEQDPLFWYNPLTADYMRDGMNEPANANGTKIDWVIVGGESGPNRRDLFFHGTLIAIVSVSEQCKSAGVPVYVKQDVAFKSGQQGRIPDSIWALKQFPK